MTGLFLLGFIMIDIIAIVQHEDLEQLSGSDLIKQLDDIEQNPILYKILIESIPTNKINGQEIIDSEFISFVIHLDPIAKAEKMLGIEKHSKEADSDEVLGLTSLISFIKKAYLIIINKIGFDFSASSVSFHDYCLFIVSLGFKEIIDDSYRPKYSEKDETVKVFFHYDYSMLWSITSTDFKQSKIVNKSTLHFCAKERDQLNGINSLNLSCSFYKIPLTDMYAFSFQMRELPSFKFFEIISNLSPIKHWAAFNVLDPELSNLIEKLPDTIFHRLFDYNVACFYIDNVKHINERKNAIVINAVNKILDSLTKEEQVYSAVFRRAQKFADLNTVLLPDFLMKRIKKYSEIPSDFLISSLGFYIDKRFSHLIQIDSLFHDIVRILKKEDFVDFYNTYIDMDDNFKMFYIEKELEKEIELKMKKLDF